MKKISIDLTGAATLELQAAVHRSEEALYEHRLHAILLVSQGFSCKETARLLGDCPDSVENWVHQFSLMGLPGLAAKTRDGRPARLGSFQYERIADILAHSPKSAGIDALVWTGKMLSTWIRREWNMSIQTRQCQRILRQAKMRFRKT